MTQPISTRRSAAGDDRTLPIIVYVLFLVGLANGVTLLIGFIMAYALKRGAGELARSHYVFQIRTVWIWLAGLAVAVVLMMFALPLTFILIGFGLLPVATGIALIASAWFVIRCVAGLVYLAGGQPYPRPAAWLI